MLRPPLLLSIRLYPKNPRIGTLGHCVNTKAADADVVHKLTREAWVMLVVTSSQSHAKDVLENGDPVVDSDHHDGAETRQLILAKVNKDWRMSEGFGKWSQALMHERRRM